MWKHTLVLRNARFSCRGVPRCGEPLHAAVEAVAGVDGVIATRFTLEQGLEAYIRQQRPTKLVHSLRGLRGRHGSPPWRTSVRDRLPLWIRVRDRRVYGNPVEVDVTELLLVTIGEITPIPTGSTIEAIAVGVSIESVRTRPAEHHVLSVVT